MKGIISYFDHSFIVILTLVLMAIGILFQVAIGVIYQRMIQAADTLSGTDSKLLNQCKERFVNCYKLNGGVVSLLVAKELWQYGVSHQYLTRIDMMQLTINFQS